MICKSGRDMWEQCPEAVHPFSNVYDMDKRRYGFLNKAGKVVCPAICIVYETKILYLFAYIKASKEDESRTDETDYKLKSRVHLK